VDGNVEGEEHSNTLYCQQVELIEGLRIFGEVVLVNTKKGIPEIISHHTSLSSQHSEVESEIVVIVEIFESINELDLLDIAF